MIHVAIVGGGIAGIAAALRVRERSPSATVTLLEAGTRLGGTIATERRDGFGWEGEYAFHGHSQLRAADVRALFDNEPGHILDCDGPLLCVASQRLAAQPELRCAALELRLALADEQRR